MIRNIKAYNIENSFLRKGKTMMGFGK